MAFNKSEKLGIVRALRIKAGLSQYALAKAMGVCRRTITAIETGGRDVTFKDAVTIEYIARTRASVPAEPKVKQDNL